MNDYFTTLPYNEKKESIVDRYAEGYRQGYKDGREDAKNEMKYTFSASTSPAIVRGDTKYAHAIEKGPSIEVRGEGVWIDKNGYIRYGGQNEDNKA